MGAGEGTKAFQENPFLVQRGDGREIEFLAQRKVLRATARGDVDDTGALRLPHLVPQDHSVCLWPAGGLLGLEFVKGAVVGPTFQCCALHFFQHLISALQDRQCAFGEIKNLVPLADFYVGQFRPHRRRDVAG